MRAALVLALTLLVVNVRAAVPSQQVTWVQPNVTPNEAQSFFYSLTITEEGNPTPRTVSLLAVLCGGPTNAAECSAPLPASAQSAIITGNSSQIKALDGRTNQSSAASAPFKGDQGCIFRDNLTPVGERAQAQTNKQGMNNLLAEFQRAKFDHVSTTNLKGNQFLVIEQCVGYLVPEGRKQ